MICCQNIVVTLLKKYGMKVGGVNELFSNLGNKSKHVVHTEIFCCIYHLE